MLRRFASLTAALAAAAVLSMSAFATNGGIVGNVVDAGEDIVNDVVDAGENVVDDVTDAVTGDNNNTTDNNTNNSTGDTTSSGGTNTSVPDETPPEADTNNGTTSGNTNGTTGGTINDTTTPGTGNPNTGISFPFAAVAALALGGAGVAFTLRKDN